MDLIPIDSLDDPRLHPYRDLKDRELARFGDLFIAEGEFIVQRLLASDFPVESMLVSDRKIDDVRPILRAGVPVYVTDDHRIKDLLGYKFHSGVMACGRRKPSPSLEQALGPPGHQPMTLVICPDLINADNLGSLFRLSAGFGVTAMILGPECHDPFWRRCIRVSMGAVFTLPIVRSPDLLVHLHRLRNDWQVELIATVLDPAAEPLAHAKRRSNLGILFGSEDQGLSDQWIAACDRKVTIPMHHNTDSLNVTHAAGIFLYHFTDVSRP